VLTFNRADEVLRTLQRLTRLPERPPVIVVDNGSEDGTADRVGEAFGQVEVVRCRRNLGAAGRNAGVARAGTPYVAFCDDDTWWEPGALGRAADLLDAHPDVAAVAARVLVGDNDREDPTCAAMAQSPLRWAGLPGPALIGFMAGAVVMRADAFRRAGGYAPELFLGGEERLLGLDLAAAGWRMVYAADVVTHHHPSALRDAPGRRVLLARNAAWIACLRLRWPTARREILRAWRGLQGGRECMAAVAATLRGLPWAFARRRVVPREVESMMRQVLGWPGHERRGRVARA